jgi:hypothetical protein
MKQVFSVLSVTCVAFFTIFLSTTNVGCKKGDDGAKGDTGNANVAYSAWLNVAYQKQALAPGDTIIVAGITAPKLTDSILHKGDVKVFINVGTASDPTVVPLPYGYSIIPLFSKGQIILQADDLDWGTYTQGGQTYQQYRYVLIQGSVGARSAVNWNDYEAVKKHYNIPD